jgi:hypothetical protein
LREIDQSRAPSSHLPNWPSRMCSGTQVICWFSSTIRSRNCVTCTNHESTARWISGFPQRQQCGYGVVVGLVAQQQRLRVRAPVRRSRMICGFASNTSMPVYGGTVVSNSPRVSTGTTASIPPRP